MLKTLNIKNSFIILIISNFLIIIFFLINHNYLKSYNNKLLLLEKYKSLMIRNANILRQSSNNLTRFARTYLVTLNDEYRDNYFDILNIRNGKDYKPKYYERIYWDYSKIIRNTKIKLDKKISFLEQSLNLPFTNEELLLLKKAQINSNKLASFEIELINHIYDISKNNYKIKLEEEQKKAILKLNSISYHKAKEDIMRPIDLLFTSIDSRIENKVNYLNNKIKIHTMYVYILFYIFIIILVFTFIILFKKILYPISKLNLLVNNYNTKNTHIDKIIINNDEIGELTRSLHYLKNRTEMNYEIIKDTSFRDTLTTLYNQKYYNIKLLKYISMYNRYDSHFSLILICIHNVNNIKNKYGEESLKQLLKDFAALLEEKIRNIDSAFRINNDEFIILLPITQQEEAHLVALKLKVYISLLNTFKNDTVSVNIGLTSIKKDDTPELMYKRVKELVLVSKNKGQNIISHD